MLQCEQKENQGKRKYLMVKLYLDIDGVLVSGGKATEGIVEFLRFATENFDCYWLTTHCHGDAKLVFLYLVSRVPAEALAYIEKFKPTRWGGWKTEAIDFSSPFYWLDDNLFDPERQVLIAHDALASFILMDLTKNPLQLAQLAPFLSLKIVT
jgi:hypothetical protein